MGRKSLAVLLFVLVIFILSGCATVNPSGYENGKQYSTTKADEAPLDFSKLQLTPHVKQTNYSGTTTVFVTYDFTNNTDVTFVNIFTISISSPDGGNGIMTHSGSIAPGETVVLDGYLMPATPGKTYTADDLKYKNINTEYILNEKQNMTLRLDFETGTISWYALSKY